MQETQKTVSPDARPNPDETGWPVEADLAMQAMFVHAPIPVFLLGDNGSVLMSNRAFAPADNKSQGIGEALRCVNAFAEDGSRQCGHASACSQCPLRLAIRECLRSRHYYHRRPVTLCVTGQEHSEDLYLLLSSIPICLGQSSAVLLYMEDVTELHRMRIIAEQFNVQLEKEVNARTREVRQLLDQKQAFVNQLGHDLRTPLTPLVALLPLLRQRVGDPKAREMLDVIQSNTEYMWDLVSRTLDLIQATRPDIELDLEVINVVETINAALRDLGPLMAKKQIEAVNTVDPPLYVHADLLALREILANLMGNALKFMPVGGKLTCSAGRTGRMVEMAIQDTGIGMMPAQLDRIFDEFYKIDESRHDRQSPGLGLSICRRIVENHGGRIWAESEGLGKGSTLRFTLPAWGESLPASPLPSSAQRGQQTRND
jgi:signal transduction histidine kinase